MATGSEPGIVCFLQEAWYAHPSDARVTEIPVSSYLQSRK